MSDIFLDGTRGPHADRRSFLQVATGLPLLLIPTGPVNAMLTRPPGENLVPFRVAVPQRELDDLRQRLADVRWPEPETVSNWSQGVPLAKAKTLVDYWRDHHDWRRFEARLNAYPQFRTTIDGLAIHFIHVRSRHRNALPIVLTHGWPGSVVEFLDVIEPLTDPTAHGGEPRDAFDVIIPSLPGFGFSDKPDSPIWDLPRIAGAWATLVKRLGYTRWVAQGGDWGSGVTHMLAKLRPNGLLAAHTNWPLVFPTELPALPTPEEKRAIEASDRFYGDGYGYFKLNATRPQTIGYALADSPIGQAMWIYEKFQAWTDNNGNPEDALTIDQILDNISLYWFTNSAASSARIYWQNSRAGPLSFSFGNIDLPMAATIFPAEIYRAPKSWATALWSKLIYWNEVDRGGHFAAFEQPTLFSEEMRKAFRRVRTR